MEEPWRQILPGIYFLILLGMLDAPTTSQPLTIELDPDQISPQNSVLQDMDMTCSYFILLAARAIIRGHKFFDWF